MLFFRSKASTRPQRKPLKRWHCKWELLCFLRRGRCLSAWKWRWVLVEEKSIGNGLTYVHFQIHMKVDLRWEPCGLLMELSLPSIPAPMKSDIYWEEYPNGQDTNFTHHGFITLSAFFKLSLNHSHYMYAIHKVKKEIDAIRALTFLLSWMRWRSRQGGMERWKELKRLSREWGTCVLMCCLSWRTDVILLSLLSDEKWEWAVAPFKVKEKRNVG